MAQFPRTEAQIFALVQEMAAGLAANAAVYPAPPVSPVDLGTLLNTYAVAKNDQIAAEAAVAAAADVKDDALAAMVDGMKADLRYAENTVNYDDAQLKLIGWAGRAAATALQAPGQARLFEAAKQGEGWIFLDWKAPTEGGKPAAYRVLRRNRPDGPWTEVATAVVTEATLVEQPRGIELEYRAVAVNKAGDGEPSNTAMVVL